MMGEIQVQVQPPSGTIVLNRPQKRNALSRMLMKNLSQALDDLHQEKRVRAVIVTARDPAFCAGMDLDEMKETFGQDDPLSIWRKDAVAYKELVEKMLQFPKPLIAAVNGPAVAGGAGLVLACDIVVAGRRATFGLPEPRRGLVAGLVAPLLYFRVGGSTSALLLLTGRVIEAEDGRQMGVFHEVVDDQLLWARAHQLAEECARNAPQALQQTRRMLNETIGEHLTTLLSAGAAASATGRTTEAAEEGIAAFLEKRPPQWP